MSRGGRRPGAGAPKGNLNALKHGLRSAQVRALTDRFATDPTMRTYLARLAQLTRRHRSHLRAEHLAQLAVAAWLRHTGAVADAGPWPTDLPLPRMSRRAVRLLARHIAAQTISQRLVRYSHQPPRKHDQ